MRICTFEDCNKKHDSHGYCANHARQYRKYGHPLSKEEKSKQRADIIRRVKPALGKKWTEERRKAHSARLKGRTLNTGKTHFKKGMKPWNKGKRVEALIGEKNWIWKGDDVSYRNLHRWVERYLGRPSTCEECKVTGLSEHQIHWSNISGDYYRELNDWQRLCAKCHGAYDKKLRMARMRG